MNAPSTPFAIQPKDLRRQLLTQGYEPLPICGKYPRYEGWSEGDIADARLAEIETAHPDHLNTGIRTGRCVGIDIDLTDEAHAAEVEKVIAAYLGETSLRRVGSKGALLCYFNRTPVRKITIGTKKKRLVEFLGDGQQFAAYGNHPGTGKAYEWPNDIFGGEPLQTPLASLPEVTSDALRKAASAVATRLAELGYADVTVSEAGTMPEPSASTAANGRPVSTQIVEAMLRRIPPSCDRNQWLTVCGGLHNAPVTDSEWDGADLFVRWSSGELHDETPANFKGADDCEREWNRDQEKHAKGEAVPAFGALVNLAREHGYDGPTHSESCADTFAHIAEQSGEQNKAEPESGKRRNHFSTRAEDRALPPPQWLIHGLIEDGADVALVAPSKSLKTFLAVDIAGSVATGLLALGKLAVARQAPVFYCAAEGAHSLKRRRMTAWEIGRGLAPYSADRVHVAAGAPLLNSEAAAEFLEDAKAHLKPGERAGLFIIDTMNRALNGADEDKSSTASAYFNMLAAIRGAVGGATLTIHHMGKNLDKGARGSSAFYAGFDTVIMIDRADKDEKTGCYHLTVRVDKQKDGEDGKEFFLRARRVETPDGASLVLEQTTEDEAKRAAGKQVGLRRSELGAALREFGACPSGTNAWDGKRGGTTTHNLAELIARARARAEGGRGTTEKEINVLVAALNKGARDGGPFEAYVVHSPKSGRQWAIVDGTPQEEIPHA